MRVQKDVVRVGRLRQKLATYYQTEASGDPVLVSLPKGAFKLNFDPFQPQAPPPTAPDRKVRVLGIALAIVGIWAIAATIFLARSVRTAPVVDPWTPELEALWGPFL